MSENDDSSNFVPARVLIEVRAGIIPGQAIHELTKVFAITSDEWEKAGHVERGQSNLLAEVNGKAQGYAGLLMLQPDAFNWVKTEWLWL